MEKVDKATLLDLLERGILNTGAHIRICRIMGGDPQGFLANEETRLGLMLDAVLVLKKLDDIPSILTKVE